MKKILAAILALMMLTVTGLCFAETAEPECIEVWDIVAMFQDDVELEEGTYPFISFYLYDDGSINAEYGTQVLEGTFEETDEPLGYIFTIGGQSAPVVYDEETGCLYMENEANGQTGVFMLRAYIPAESIDEFQGVWNVISLIRSGNLISLDSEAGQQTLSDVNATDSTIVVDGSNVTIFGILEGECELADGSLIVTTANGECIITLTDENSLMLVIPGENQMINKMFAAR